MQGLLKAFLFEPLSWPIPELYLNRPDRQGCTLAYGETADWLIDLQGVVLELSPGWLVESDRAMFLTVTLCDQFRKNDGQICYSAGIKTPHAPHITLGWAEGCAAVSAGKECDRFWNTRDEYANATQNWGANDNSFNLDGFKASRVSGKAIPALIEWRSLREA
jgi:hypothetical protein